MCGRFTLRAPASVIAEQFALFELPLLRARFNIAPTQDVPVVRVRPGDSGATDTPARRELVALRWGLVPSWAKEPGIGNRLINARSETAAEKPAFRSAMKRHRCLIVADGFYEWQAIGRRKQPMFFYLADDRPFAFAGLWDTWEGADQSALETCTILTTEASEFVRPVHDRMPVILPEKLYDDWLDPAQHDTKRLLPLLKPYPSDDLEVYPVSTKVNRPGYDKPDCVERERELFDE
ncbi:MAG: SOS response-associated peptidase [Planctomycetota bacterium]